MIKELVTVTDKIGLHARTASLFAKKAAQFTSDIQIAFNGKVANGKSMLAIMTLGVKNNAIVELSANGEDEKEAVTALKNYIVNNFND